MTRPTFKEVPSETTTGQVVCDVRGSSDSWCDRVCLDSEGAFCSGLCM